MAQSAQERRATQRRIARELKAEREKRGHYQARARAETRQARVSRHDYLENMLNHPERKGDLTDAEKKSLASEASKASWGKADPRYEAAWKEFWYHDED